MNDAPIRRPRPGFPPGVAEKLAAIGAKFDPQVLADTQALYAPLDATHEQIRQQARANIRALLTPDQQSKFDDVLKQLDEQRRKNADR
jgi:Spy/CpxP family protein refolding chaperone